MSATDLSRIARAAELRKQAERYRYLASCIGDERAIEIIERMSRDYVDGGRKRSGNLGNPRGVTSLDIHDQTLLVCWLSWPFSSRVIH
jgi:hypothetical protein